MNKKYIEPVIYIEDMECEECMLDGSVITYDSDTDTQGTDISNSVRFDTKSDGTYDGEGWSLF